jgi:hypothetical protein
MKKSKYKQRPLYPHYLPWGRLIRLVAVGQRVSNDKGEVYTVKQRLISSCEGATPQLLLAAAEQTIRKL